MGAVIGLGAPAIFHHLDGSVLN